MRKIILAMGLGVALTFVGAGQIYRLGGTYLLRDGDHDAVMTVDPGNASKTVSILFVGNSLTFVNDLPAMLANVAATYRRWGLWSVAARS